MPLNDSEVAEILEIEKGKSGCKNSKFRSGKKIGKPFFVSNGRFSLHAWIFFWGRTTFARSWKNAGKKPKKSTPTTTKKYVSQLRKKSFEFFFLELTHIWLQNWADLKQVFLFTLHRVVSYLKEYFLNFPIQTIV